MDAQTAYSRRDGLRFVDVREPAEWRAGHIDGAVHIPLMQLPARLTEVAGGAEIVAVCRSGQRSDYAARWLQAQGIEAHNLDGGMESWAAAGLPFVSEYGGPPTVA